MEVVHTYVYKFCLKYFFYILKITYMAMVKDSDIISNNSTVLRNYGTGNYEQK